MNIAITAEPAPISPFESCLEPLLRSLRWRTNLQQLAEARGSRPLADISDLRTAMANLDFVSHLKNIRLAEIDPRLLPCLFVSADGRPLLLLKGGDALHSFVCFDGATTQITTMDGHAAAAR